MNTVTEVDLVEKVAKQRSTQTRCDNTPRQKGFALAVLVVVLGLFAAVLGVTTAQADSAGEKVLSMADDDHDDDDHDDDDHDDDHHDDDHHDDDHVEALAGPEEPLAMKPPVWATTWNSNDGVVEVAGTTATSLTSAQKRTIIGFYSTLIDSDTNHRDKSGEISREGWDGYWTSHHCIWGGGSQLPYTCDGSYDYYGENWQAQWVVTPFGSKTLSGDRVKQTVTAVQAACASGRIADGGYRIEILAENARTGEDIAVAQVVHVKNVRVEVGDEINHWTRLGEPDAFTFGDGKPCYQVNNDAGVHLHIEITGATHYSCMTKSVMQKTSVSEVQRHGWANTPNATGARQWC